jgi:hypothetical protein
MKYRVVCWFVAAAALICLATAQNSQVRASSAKAGPDPLQTATKPLTPKSAMPAQRKSSVAEPIASTSSRNTTAELTHLERQNIKAGGSKSGAGPAKSASAPKSANTSAGRSGIDFKYQKPVGGVRAATPDAHAANKGRPVEKH